MWSVNKNTMAFVLVPFVIVGIFLLVLGLNTSPLAKTDDGHSERLFLIIFGSFWILLAPVTLAVIALFMRRQAVRLNYFVEQGLRGTAKFLSCEMTGTEINNVPQYEMGLEIRVRGREPFGVKHKECLTALVAGKITIGMELPVLVDPRNPKKIMLVWHDRVYQVPERI